MTERPSRESAQLRERAIALRRAGKSVREIKQLLGPVGNRKLHDALRGEPPPEWTRRPNAKDDLRAEARELRRQGLDYAEIVRRLGVSKSSVSLWVRDLPRPPRIPLDECAKRTSEGIRRYWSAERPVRAAQRTAAIAAARNKPHRRVDRVTFANSDPELISFFLLFLDTAGIPRSDLAFQLQIHGTADVAAAIRFWLTVTAARPDQFRKVSLKQGNPRTTRRNTGDGYHGCLRVDVMRSCELYRKIEGWASAVTAGAEVPGRSTTVG